MADYGRYGDDQIRDRSSKNRDRDEEKDRGGWRRVRSDSDLSRETSRGSGGGTGSGSDWKSEDYGWGGDPARESGREGASRDRQGGSWFGGSGRGREEDDGRPSGRDRQAERDREGGGWFGGSGRDREVGREHDADRERESRRERETSRGRDADRDRQSESGWGRDDRSDRSGGGWAGGRDRDMDRSSRGGEQQGREFGYDDRHEGLPIDETSRLIASNKVEGTAVYGSDGHRIGSIYNFMVEKRAGKIEYAVMTYGGFMGMGTRYYPLPWDILTYDTRVGGYRVEMTERDLERAPSFDRTNEPAFDQRYGDRVRGWYGLRTA